LASRLARRRCSWSADANGAAVRMNVSSRRDVSAGSKRYGSIGGVSWAKKSCCVSRESEQVLRRRWSCEVVVVVQTGEAESRAADDLGT
jgi:hypothetical protein